MVSTSFRQGTINLFLLLATASPALAQRLPASVVPDHYTLWFAPDLTTDTFRGREIIQVRVGASANAITLHAAELQFGEVTITSGGRTQTATVSLDAATETALLKVPNPVPVGPATIAITYTGILNDKLRGFYLSQANGRKYAVTQLEATDARRAFPSFDEPAYKATFDVSLTIDQRDTAISNGAQLSDLPGPEAGKHTLTFARTAKMSTYLVAMLVGDFVCRSGSADDIPVRVCSTPDKLALTEFALEATIQSLQYYNRYFGIKYPFGKLDVVGIPDFAAGAMENTGAITFREQYLLADPQRASLGVRKSVASIVAHEVAHQWFGNLVTMKWWDDIWLNEGFATWLANKPLAEWHPEWNVHLDDVEDTQRALGTDALRSTRAIRTKVETPEEINQVFDAIAYEKTSAVIRMIEHYVGSEAFRRGVSAYLKKYSYANAAGEDFWNEVAKQTGKPVDRILGGFVNQPGAPVLTVASGCRGGASTLRLRQERFIGTPGATPQQPQTWTLPVCVTTTSGKPRCEIVSKPEHTMTMPGCAADPFVNTDSVGYFFSEYSPEHVSALARPGGRALSSAERLGLLGDEWWMVRAGRHDIGTYLNLAAEWATDESAQVTAAIAARLAYVAEYIADPGEQDGYQRWLGARFGPVYERLGMPALGDNDDKQMRYATLLELLGVAADSPEVQRHAKELAAKYLANPQALPGTVASTLLRVAAIDGDVLLYDQYRARLAMLQGEPEEYYRFFNALPYFRDPALMKRTLEFAISPEVRSQDTATMIGGLLARPWGRDQAWAFVKSQWDALVGKLGTFQGIPGVIGASGTFCSPAAAADMTLFFAAHPIASSHRAVKQAIERIETCAALNQRQSQAFASWLGSR